MAIDTYMVITDQTGATLAGEEDVTVIDPYLKRNVVNPVRLQDFSAEFENTSTLGTTGGGAGKIVFDPLTVTKTVDKISQNLFLADAMGTTYKYVDLLLVKTGAADPGGALRPFLSLRLGTVLVTDLKYLDDEDSPREDVTFVFGQFQIGYQAQKPDGTYLPFAPVGWDRIRNIKI